ncbi:hypothetical protein A2U01_0103244, partial [Trifolium medium]|nr:hypothetical protein [Trifolium medium]
DCSERAKLDGSYGGSGVAYEARTPTQTPRHDRDTDTATPLM